MALHLLHVKVVLRLAHSIQQKPLLLLLAHFLRSPVDDSIILVHHFKYHHFIRRARNRCDGNISNSPKVSTIVQVLVLKSEEVPDEPSKDFKWCENRENEVRVYVAHLNERHGECPTEPQYQILNDSKVIEPL